jgi:hypothetical protein
VSNPTPPSGFPGAITVWQLLAVRRQGRRVRGDPDNPGRFDGEFARIATSTSSAGAKVIIGAGLSSRLAGRTIRVTIDARSARENGATSMRFAYQSGVAISHWQTANLSSFPNSAWSGGCRRSHPWRRLHHQAGIPGSEHRWSQVGGSTWSRVARLTPAKIDQRSVASPIRSALLAKQAA